MTIDKLTAQRDRGIDRAGADVATAAGGPSGEARGLGVRFAGVQRHYRDTTALAGLDLDIEPGEFLALLGPSGCGKTTALRILGGFDRPDAGSVLVGGRDVTRVPAHKRDMGMVFQAYSLFPNMDVRSNVAFGMRMRREAKEERTARTEQLLELVGLASLGSRYPHELSGGQQQRVAIARSLAVEPTVLLLDEPLSALDARVRTQLRGEIRAIQQRLGITTLFVTHDQSEALSMADRVGVMNHGRLEQVGTPEDVYRRPATPFVAEFVGAMNRLAGRMGDRDEVAVLGHRLAATRAPEQAPPGSAVEVLLRPEAIQVVPDSAGPAEVTERVFLGSSVRMTVSLDTQSGGQTLLVEAPSHERQIVVGARVGIRILADRVVVVPPGAPRPVDAPMPVA